MGNTDTSEPMRARAWRASGHNGCVKRSCDLVLAGIGLVILFPVMIVIAGLLFGLGFTKPFFVQKRVGQNGQTFVIFKFRTLHDRTCRPVSRSRLRRSNRFTATLRRTGLDELPQLFNVLKGDMSLVGPRPHSLTDHRSFSARIPDYTNRLVLKPGITGWAQIHGWRGPVCNDDHLRARTACDLEYVRRQSLIFDGIILLHTLALPFKTLAHSNPWHRPCQGLKPCLHCNRRQV